MVQKPSADFPHRLADIADAETVPRYRNELAIETEVKAGYTFVGSLSQAILYTTSPEHHHGSLKAGFERLSGTVRMTRYDANAMR